MAAGECSGDWPSSDNGAAPFAAPISGRCASQSRAYTARAEHHTFIDLLYSTRPQGS